MISLHARDDSSLFKDLARVQLTMSNSARGSNINEPPSVGDRPEVRSLITSDQ